MGLYKNKTVFLDFDGVLFDTAKEAYILSRYAYNDISPLEDINKIEYQNFYNNKYLVINCWQYYFVMKFINNVKSIINDKNLFSIKTPEAEHFDIKFQECRKNLIQHNFQFWNTLDSPYSFFDEINKLQDLLDLVIVSTKNTEAIFCKLSNYGLNIDVSKIFGKEVLKNYCTKGNFLQAYINENSIKNAIFIDDNYDNIISCKNIIELKPLLAAWGYCNPKHKGYTEIEVLNIIKESL